jgi:hypothetical protein
MDRQARRSVDLAGDAGPSLLGTADTVLWSIEGDQVDFGLVHQEVDVGAPSGIDPRVIGDETYAAAGYEVQGIREKDLDARAHAL